MEEPYRRRTNSVDASRFGASFLEAHASGRLSPGRAEERRINNNPPRPPQRTPAGRQPAKSTQPRDVLAAAGAEKITHPFLRKHTRQTKTPSRDHPGQGLPVATMSLDLGYVLEENLAHRAAEWVHSQTRRPLSPARSRSPRTQSARTAQSPRTYTPRMQSPLAAPYPRLVEMQRHRQEALQRQADTEVGLRRVASKDNQNWEASQWPRKHTNGQVSVSEHTRPGSTPRGLRPLLEPGQQQTEQAPELKLRVGARVPEEQREDDPFKREDDPFQRARPLEASDSKNEKASRSAVVLHEPQEPAACDSAVQNADGHTMLMLNTTPRAFPPSPFESSYAHQYGLHPHGPIWSDTSDDDEEQELTRSSNVPTATSNAVGVDSVLDRTGATTAQQEEDRILLRHRRLSSSLISEVQEQHAKNNVKDSKMISAIGQIGVLDVRKMRPTEAANEANLRRSFIPHPPLISRSSILLKEDPKELSDKDAKPRKGRATHSFQDFPDRSAQARQGSDNRSADPAAPPSRPKTGSSTRRPDTGIGERRPQTTSRKQELLTVDQMIDAAFTSAFPVHIPPAVSIYPSSRLNLPSKPEEPILQDSKIRGLREQRKRLGVQPSPGPLQLGNVNWTDWTVPSELSARRDPASECPESSRPVNKTPMSQNETGRPHTSGDNQPLPDRPSRSRPKDLRGASDDLSVKHNRAHLVAEGMRPHTTESGVRTRGSSDIYRVQKGLSKTLSKDELRPQTVGGERGRTASSKSSKAGNSRPMTSDGDQRTGLWRVSPAIAPAESNEVTHTSEASSQTRVSTRASIQSGSTLWSNIVSDDAVGFFNDPALHSDQPGIVPRVESNLNVHSGEISLEWIGTKSYKDYIQDVENVLAETSEEELMLVQDERVRKMGEKKNESDAYSKGLLRKSRLTYALTKTSSGFLSRTSSVASDGNKAMPTQERSVSPKLSIWESKQAAKKAQEQVFFDLNTDIHSKLRESKWGTREAPTVEGGFADLIQCQEYADEFQSKYETVQEKCRRYFETQSKQEKQQLLLEGRAHSTATMVESKCYVSAFYSGRLERLAHNNELATKDWTGMTGHEIMMHAQFLSDLEYVKLKSNDLISRMDRQSQEIVKRTHSKTIARVPSNIVSKGKGKISRTDSSQSVGRQIPTCGRAESSKTKRGYLRIFVLEAADLPKLSDKKESADTYVRCDLCTEGKECRRDQKGFVEKTEIAWNSLSPSWKQGFEFVLPETRENIALALSVFDVHIDYKAQATNDTLIGTLEIPIFKEGYQTMSADQETTKWATLYKDQQVVVSSQKEHLGRNSMIKISYIFTRKDRMNLGTSALCVQTAYRCHLARAKFERQKARIEELSNRQILNPEIVEKLDKEHTWDSYLQICLEENAKPVSECRRQFSNRESFRLENYYVPYRAVCAICRMLVEVYPHGRLKNLELKKIGINSPGMVVIANAIRVGCTALNSLTLTGNHITQEANDVAQANHPITNRLGKGLSGCRAIAEAVNETKTLRRLSFAGCRLGDEGLAEIAKALQDNRSVEFLDLSDTNEDPMGAMPRAAKEVGKMLAVNVDLIEVQLHSIGFPGQSALALLGGGNYTSIGLRLNASLRILNLRSNNLCRSLAANAALRDFLSRDTCFLEHLDLGYNHMDQHGVLVFSDGLIANNSLRNLILDGNELGVVGCRMLLSYRGRKTVLGTSTQGLADSAISRKPKSKIQVRTIFEKFDRDHSGAMDVREMHEFLDSLSDHDLGTAESIIAAIDADNSGAIEFDEFYEWYMRALGIEDDGDKPVEISLEHCGGYTNVKGFDPTDPNGRYRLVMSELSSRSALLCMMQMVFAGKAEFLDGTMMRIDEGQDDESAKKYTLDISDDPTSWTVPEDGILVFEFGALRQTAGVNDCVGTFIMNHLCESYSKATGTKEERHQALLACSGEDSFFLYKQIVALLNLLDKAAEADLDRQATLSEERVTLVARLYLRMVDKENNSKLLDRLNAEERVTVEEMLGIVAMEFDANNATGYHRLDLKNPFEREVMVRLIEIRNSQRNEIFKWRKHLNRASSGREEFEIVFRNLKYHGGPLVYSSSWRAPEFGVVEVDFVDIRKPDPRKAKAMDAHDFLMLLESLDQSTKKPTTKASEIRKASNMNYFTCLQLWKLLSLFDKQKPDESRCRSSCCAHQTHEHKVACNKHSNACTQMCSHSRFCLVNECHNPMQSHVRAQPST